MASTYDTKTYCRQTLIGGNYGLLNTTNFVPNPDYYRWINSRSFCITQAQQISYNYNFPALNFSYNLVPCIYVYSALLWHQLMGENVLSANFSGTKKIRAYANCAKNSVSQNLAFFQQLHSYTCSFYDEIRVFTLQQGITLLLINLDNTTTVETKVAFNSTRILRHKHKSHGHRAKVVRIHQQQKKIEMMREEYHLTAKDDNLHSQIMLLNGKILTVNSSGHIPPLVPVKVNSSEPITVAPFSVVFSHIPNVVLPACRQEGTHRAKIGSIYLLSERNGISCNFSFRFFSSRRMKYNIS